MCKAARTPALISGFLVLFSTSIQTQTTIPVPGRIEVEDYSSFFDLTTGNAGGGCRSDDVDLFVILDEPDAGCTLGHTQATEWLGFQINVTQDNTYVLSARVAHPGVGGTFHVELDGVNVTGAMTVPDTGDWGAYRTIRIHGISVTTGLHALKLVMDTTSAITGAVGNFNYLALTTSAAFGGAPRAVPGLIQMEDFDVNPNGGSGQGFAYHDATPANIGGAYRPTEAVDMALTDDGGAGSVQVGWTERGEWLAYSVYIHTHGGYQLSLRVAHPGAGGTFHMEVDGKDVTGPIQIPDTGGFSNWQTVTALTGYLPQGRHVIYLVLDTESSVTGAIANVNHFELSPNQAIRVTPSTSSVGAALGIDQFPRFMLNFSYFGALEHDITTIRNNFIQAHNPRNPEPPPQGQPPVPPGFGPEFDIVRIFPNFWADSPPKQGETPVDCSNPRGSHPNIYRPDTGNTGNLFTPSGGINPDARDKLKLVIDAAKEIGLYIQLSMAIEPVPGMTKGPDITTGPYGTAMRELARLLSEYTYTEANGTVLRGASWVALEVQNEFPIENTRICKPSFTRQEIAALINIVKDPTPGPDAFRLTTLTFGGSASEAERVRAETGVDFIAWEEQRTLAWDDQGWTYTAVRDARRETQNAIAITLGETLSFDQAVTDPGLEPPQDWTAEDWWQAAREAKRAGAGFWCWHTRALFLYTDSPFHNGQFHPTEITVLEQLRQQVNAEPCWGRAFPMPDFRPPGVPCP